MRIVFMGTPAFAVPSLAALLKGGHEVIAVVTATDKLGGRGGKTLIQSAVKEFALEQSLPLLQPEKLKNPEFLAALRALKADLQVVVAFRMLPEVVWDMPRLGTVNLHGSLLPQYRGAAPINWAIINGETETGLTTFFLQHEIDTGDLLFQARTPIAPHETAGQLHDRLMLMGADLLLHTVNAIEAGTYSPTPQVAAQASHAPKLFTENCLINFNQSTASVYNFIRGLSPHPTAWTSILELPLKVYAAAPEIAAHTLPIGKWLSDNKTYFKVSTNDGFIHFTDIQLQGRSRMPIKAFLNGYPLPATD